MNLIDIGEELVHPLHLLYAQCTTSGLKLLFHIGLISYPVVFFANIEDLRH